MEQQTQTDMTTNEKHNGPNLDKEHGYYASATVAKSLEEIYLFCQDENNVKKVLTDLPLGIDNFLSLELENSERSESDSARISWRNRKGSKTSGNLTFLLKKAPASRGTLITAQAKFEKFNFKEEGPSTLMNVFLKRMKALMETGEIPTTKGQPSGREEINPKEEKTVH